MFHFLFLQMPLSFLIKLSVKNLVCDWQWAEFLLEREKVKKNITIENDLFSEKQLGKLKYRYHDVLSL